MRKSSSISPPQSPSAAFVPLADEQLKHVDHLRSQVLLLLRKAGHWQEIEGYPGRLRSYDEDRLFILHRTPFQPPPVSEAAVAAGISAAAQKMAAREYGMDIWLDNKKVFSAIWNEGDAIGVVVYRQGLWEEELMRAVKAC